MRSTIADYQRNLPSSPSTTSSPVSPTFPSSSGFSSEKYDEVKKTAWSEMKKRDEAVKTQRGSDTRDDVKLDLKRCLFERANFEDVLHADEMWKKSRLDLAKFAVTKDEEYLSLFVGPRS